MVAIPANLAVAGFFLMALLLGGPVWWHATAVYRAEVPRDRLEQLGGLANTILKIDVVIDSALSDTTGRLTARLRNTLGATHHGYFSYSFDVTARVAALPGRQLTDAEEEASLRSAIGKPVAPHAYTFVLVAGAPQGTVPELHLGASRIAWMETSKPSLDLDSFSDHIANFMMMYLREANEEDGPAVRVGTDYEVVFTLLNAEPTAIQPTWDIAGAVDTYIYPMLDALEGVADFRVTSQILHFTLPGRQPRRDKAGNAYYTSADLPHFLAAGPWNVDVVTHTDPTLNMLLYIPLRAMQPLTIESNSKSRTGFLVPKWGGLVLCNVRNDSSTHESPATLHLDAAQLLPHMQEFIAQMRQLLGIKRITYPTELAGAKIVPLLSPIGVTEWEADALVRRRTFVNMAAAFLSLSNLYNLLDTIPAMPFSDVIRDDTVAALEAMETAVAALSQGKMDGAVRAAVRAARHAHEASTDPSGLAMLYFPEEHKYAIYIPFFAPVSLPILTGFLYEWRKWRAATAAANAAAGPAPQR